MFVSGAEKAVLVPVSVDDAISHELIMRRGEWGGTQHSPKHYTNTLKQIPEKQTPGQTKQALSLECTPTIFNTFHIIISYTKELLKINSIYTKTNTLNYYI